MFILINNMSGDWKPIEYKFILLGDSTVGKSSIYNRLKGNCFVEDNMATLGTDKCKIQFDDIIIDEKENITQNFDVILFDTAGQERYKSITKSYFRDAQGIILIYSVTDEKSFDHIQTWLQSIKDSLADWKRAGYMVMLLANKLDLAEEDFDKREVLTEEAEKLCSEQRIYWGGECSAKTFEEAQIKEIFEKFLKKVHIKVKTNNSPKMQVAHLSKYIKKKDKIKKQRKSFCKF